MRRIGDEILLAAHESRHAAGHVVEGPRERALLRASLDRGTRLEIARGDAPGRPVEAGHRARDRARDDEPRDQPHAEDDGSDEHEAGGRAPNGPVHGGDALRDPHGADRWWPGRAADRHRRGQEILAEGAAVAGAPVDAPRERRGDLGAPAVGGAHEVRPGAVGQQAPTCVDDDHAPAHGGARSGHERLQIAAVRGGASRSAEVAASTSAWLRACERTSSSTRRGRSRPGGPRARRWPAAGRRPAPAAAGHGGL